MTAADAPPLLKVGNLETVYHGVVRVLRGISLEVPEGGVVALLGPNGAGKTTTLRAITGLLDIHDGEVTKGVIEFGGRSLVGQAADAIVRSGVAQVMEGRRVFAELTIEENLLAGAFAVPREQARASLDKFLERFPILGERRPPTRGLPLRRRAADVGHRQGVDGATPTAPS